MPFTISQIKKRISTGLIFIKDEQLCDGSFLSLSANNRALENASVHKTIFITSLILGCLENISTESSARKIISGGIRFLLHEKSPRWSWNYWPQTKTIKSEKNISSRKKIPDDMDDTFTALIAITIHRPSLIDPTVFFYIREHLQKTKHILSGLHNTWIIDYRTKTTWDETDLIINSTVGYFLMRHGSNAEHIHFAIEKTLSEQTKNSLISQYYSAPSAALYFLSRFLMGDIKPFIKKTKILSPSTDISALDAALTLTTLIHCDVPKNKLSVFVEHILQTPWDACGFYTESIKNNVPFYAGSTALTAAFCIEALSKYMLYE